MPTLADVIKRANVSEITVSRVINHPEQVIDELRELVSSVMVKLDCRPSIIVGALITNRSQIIKLFILEEIDTTEPYYVNLLMGIAKRIGKAHYFLQLTTNGAFDAGSCDGYIITGIRKKDLDWTDRLEKPVVLSGGNSEGYDYVDNDNEYGVVKAVQYASERSYQTIIYIDIEVDEPFEISGEAGCSSVMKEANLPSKILRFPNHSTEVERYMTENWVDFIDKTCFVCNPDRLALGVAGGVISAGGHLPEESGAIGFDGVFLDQISSPKLAMIRQDIIRMGEVCGEMSLKKVEEKGASQGYCCFFPELVIRGTTS